MHQPNDVAFATVHLATGLKLYYAERGNREGAAIVFLHAYGDSWFSCGRVLPLLPREHHAFALDQRGHGGSDKPECCYTVDDFAADVDAFMDAVGIEEATLVGDSRTPFSRARNKSGARRRFPTLPYECIQRPATWRTGCGQSGSRGIWRCS